MCCGRPKREYSQAQMQSEHRRRGMLRSSIVSIVQAARWLEDFVLEYQRSI